MGTTAYTPETTIFSSGTFKSHPRNQNRKQSIGLLFRFWNDVFRTRNVMRTSCVMTASPCVVRFARAEEHITSLCAIGAIHHCERSEQHHCGNAATSLFTNARNYGIIISSKVFPKINGLSRTFRYNVCSTRKPRVRNTSMTLSKKCIE